jgi:hypothetical protein
MSNWIKVNYKERYKKEIWKRLIHQKMHQMHWDMLFPAPKTINILFFISFQACETPDFPKAIISVCVKHSLVFSSISHNFPISKLPVMANPNSKTHYPSFRAAKKSHISIELTFSNPIGVKTLYPILPLISSSQRSSRGQKEIWAFIHKSMNKWNCWWRGSKWELCDT